MSHVRVHRLGPSLPDSVLHIAVRMHRSAAPGIPTARALCAATDTKQPDQRGKSHSAQLQTHSARQWPQFGHFGEDCHKIEETPSAANVDRAMYPAES